MNADLPFPSRLTLMITNMSVITSITYFLLHCISHSRLPFLSLSWQLSSSDLLSFPKSKMYKILLPECFGICLHLLLFASYICINIWSIKYCIALYLLYYIMLYYFYYIFSCVYIYIYTYIHTFALLLLFSPFPPVFLKFNVMFIHSFTS